MTSRMLSTAMRRAQRQVRHVEPVGYRAATGLVARVYAQLERDFGMLAPPVSLHSPSPQVLAAAWLMLRETLLADGVVDRATKEAIATAVSVANDCPYCVEVHGATQARMGVVDDVSEWLRGGPEPFDDGQRAEYVGVALTFEYLNRMVSAFLPESPLPDDVPVAGHGFARRLLGFVTAPDTPVPQGDALSLLPAAEPPADLSWAAVQPTIHSALAAAFAAIEQAGERAVPVSVRAVVADALRTYQDRPPGLSGAWMDEPLAGLSAGDRPAGRLALTAALAPYRATAAVGDYRRACPGDDALIELTAWSCLTAARQRAAKLLKGRK